MIPKYDFDSDFNTVFVANNKLESLAMEEARRDPKLAVAAPNLYTMLDMIVTQAELSSKESGVKLGWVASSRELLNEVLKR